MDRNPSRELSILYTRVILVVSVLFLLVILALSALQYAAYRSHELRAIEKQVTRRAASLDSVLKDTAGGVPFDFLHGYALQSDYAHGKWMVLDAGCQVLAHSGPPSGEAPVSSWEDMLPDAVQEGCRALLNDLQGGSWHGAGCHVFVRPLIAATWRLVYVVPESDLFAQFLPNLAISSVTVLGLALFLVIANLLLKRQFVRPAVALVDYIRTEAVRGPTSIPRVPPAWEEWFALISDLLPLKGVAANLPGAVFQLVRHDEGRVTIPFVSAGIKELLGVDPEDLTGPDEYEMRFIPEDDRPRFIEAMKRSASTLTPLEYESRIRTAAGQEKWVRFLAKPRPGKASEIVWDGIVLDITAHKRSDRQVQLLGQIIQQMKDAVILTGASPESRIRYVNDAFSAIYGYTRDEILGQPSWVLFAGDDEERERVSRERAEAITRKGECRIEYRDQRKDGTVFWVSNTTSIVYLGEEREPHDLGIVRDITDRKLAEEALQHRAKQLEVLNEVSREISRSLDSSEIYETMYRFLTGVLDCNALFVSSFDPHTELIRCEYAAQLGQVLDPTTFPPIPLEPPGQGTQSEAIRTGAPLYLPDYQAGFESAHTRYAVTDDGTVTADIPDDPDRTRSALIVPLKLRGQVTGVIQVLSRNLDAFSDEDLRLVETLAHQVAVALENAQLYQELRIRAQELEGRVRERTAQIQAQYARLEAILHSASDGIIVTDGTGGILQANPVARAWLEHTLSPEDAAGLREMVQSLARRAAERPEAVLELRGLDVELKAAPILEPEVKETEAAAVVVVHDVSHLKALDRMKTHFVSNVSHELRTPVTTIKLYAALMRQQPERWETFLDILTREADHQARLVEDILQVSRIDTGRLEMEPRPTSLNTLSETIVASHRVLAQDRGLELEHCPAEVERAALVDPKRMMQVLNNLVENAIRYTPAGGKVKVSTGERGADGRVWATVTVADTGIGIPREELSHVFDRFFRGEEPRLMQISGTGLGLSIVKEIVELHGGRVTVESQVGEGSTFTVWLPFAE
jgi:PAS domain S-box-containing protein